MGNRTFVIMLTACLIQILVVGGTVSYVALRDGGPAELAEAESGLAPCGAYGDNDGGSDGSYLYPASSSEDAAGAKDGCEIEEASGKTPGLKQSGSYAD